MKIRLKRRAAAAALVLFCAGFAGCGGKETSVVKRVIDGDSLELRDGRQVRLIGIDAPEYSTPGADLATNYLEKLVSGRKVDMKRDRRDKDKYGRLLRYVYSGGCFVNEEMVKKGYAQVICFEDAKKHLDELLGIQEIAKSSKTGLWAFGVFETGEETASEVVSWSDAAKYYNKFVAVEGRVVRAYNSGKACFLNFDSDWKNSFSAVIFSKNFKLFPAPPEEIYKGKKVRVTGRIKKFKDSPEILVESPGQISILER